MVGESKRGRDKRGEEEKKKHGKKRESGGGGAEKNKKRKVKKKKWEREKDVFHMASLPLGA